MTTYKATPEQWEVQEKFAPESEDAACLLELRSRIERLELGAGIHDAVIKTLSLPSLKEKALKVLNDVEASGCFYVGDRGTIRRALEQLDD